MQRLFKNYPVTSVSDITEEGIIFLQRKYKVKTKHSRIDKMGNPIHMKLSFDEWLEIWISSGHLHEMGCGRSQYCLSRINDIGHYEKENVFVNLVINNSIEIDYEMTELDKKINAHCIKTGYKRRTIKAMIARGELVL
jgi:hypothetical protein